MKKRIIKDKIKWCEHIQQYCDEWILVNYLPQVAYDVADDWRYCPRCGAKKPK